MKNIRNFCIISHIDSGKSTLADRFLEMTGAVERRKMKEQFLDSMDLEREKGITIKMQPVRMEYQGYILNLIDTPGHVDFSYEVSRALAAVEGAILLVDATRGVQAQTLANLELARKQNLVIIPAVNKIDSSQARIEEAKKDLSNLLNIPEKEIFLISAKMGINVKELLGAVIEKIPCPGGYLGKPLRALIFDSKYDSYKGVIAFVRIFDGEIKKGEKIYLIHGKVKEETKEIGVFRPELTPTKRLRSGEIGFIATGIKELERVEIGETITNSQLEIEALPGYQKPKPMVFTGFYPEKPDDYELLKESLGKLKLNDASFIFEPKSKEALGRGFLCGFLGSLHAEIISERLKREFGLELIILTPSVVFQIINQEDKEFLVFSSLDWPPVSEIKEAREPWVKLEIITPLKYLGSALGILKDLRGKAIESKCFGTDKIFLTYEVPFKGIIFGFHDNLKGTSQGFASMNYEVLGYRKADLVKLEILIAGQKEEAFSKIVYRDAAYKEGRKLIERLKEVLPAQLFSVSLQAVVSGKIIARETIKARRKDVTSALYGGDYTRKSKLLKKQKKGKQKLKGRGNVRIPSRVFLEIFKGG